MWCVGGSVVFKDGYMCIEAAEIREASSLKDVPKDGVEYLHMLTEYEPYRGQIIRYKPIDTKIMCDYIEHRTKVIRGFVDALDSVLIGFSEVIKDLDDAVTEFKKVVK